jgi:hypothetical protein
MSSMLCNVDFEYQLSVSSRIERKLDVAGRRNFWMNTDISQQSTLVIHSNYVQNSVRPSQRTNSLCVIRTKIGN